MSCCRENPFKQSSVFVPQAVMLSRYAHNMLSLAVGVQRYTQKAAVFAGRNLVEMDGSRGRSETAGSDKAGCGCGKSSGDKPTGALETALETQAGSASDAPPSRCNNVLRHRWNDLVRDAFHAHYLMRKALVSAKAAMKELQAAGIDPASDAARNRLKTAWRHPAHRKLTASMLLRYGLAPSVTKAVLAKLDQSEGDWSSLSRGKTFADLVGEIAAMSDAFGRRIRKTMVPASDLAGYRSALAGAVPLTHETSVDINCADLPEDLQDICTFLVIVVVVIAIISTIGAIIGSLIDWLEDDDRARDRVNSRDCDEIADMSNAELVSLINRMIDGFTGDDDENAILRVLNCVPCDRVRTIVADVGRGTLLDNFDGTEWDELMLRLQECGLAGFDEWDDDATRRFIRESDCATINSLTDRELRRLLLNLFDGFTGDDDERAIIDLINCLPCGRVHDLLSMSRLSVDDFDSEVDGDEWDELAPILRHARDHC